VSAPDFESLLLVQDLDVAADQHRHRLEHLPARARLTAIGARRADLDRRRRAERVVRDEVVGRQTALEAELAATEQRRREVSARLYGGSVSASRDLQAMASEVETLSARASQLEDEGIAVLDELEPLEVALGALEAEEAALDAEEVEAKEEAEQTGGELRAELEALEAQRAVAAAAVPADLLATYERLRDRLGGVGAARLVGDRCGGCHLTLPSTELDRVRHLPADVVVTCEQCGRILVRSTP